MRALLKDDALRLFEERVIKLTANKDGYTENKTDHILCLHSVTEHVFPYQAVQSQKRHMQYSIHLELHSRSINEFCTHWHQLDNYIVKFPPFGENQKFMENETIKLIYNKLPGCWKSWMSKAKYVPLEHSLDQLFDYMECYELADAFNLLVKQAQEMNDSNEDKNKKKQKGQKHHKKSSDDDTNALVS
jgi:hypothetical protein